MELHLTRVRRGKEFLPAYQVDTNLLRPVPERARKSAVLVRAIEIDITIGAVVEPRKQLTVLFSENVCPSTRVWGGNGRAIDFTLSRSHADNIDQEVSELRRRRNKSWKHYRRSQYKTVKIDRQQEERFVKSLSY